MPKVSSRALKVLSVGLAGAAVLGIATVPAFAAPAPRPHVPLTANQIMKKANADFQAASSVYVYAKIFSVTTTVQVAPQGCLTSVDGDHGFWSQNLAVGGSEWVRLSDQAWQALGYTGTDLGYVTGKWVTLAAYLKLFGVPNPTRALTPCHSHEPFGLPSSRWTLDKKMVKVSGQWAWRLSGLISRHVSVTADVSDTRTPEFLAVTLLGVTERLSRYNAPVTLAAPPAADVITSLPPLPPGSIPVPDRLARVDRLVPGLPLAVAK